MTLNSTKAVMAILFLLAAAACADKRIPAKKSASVVAPEGPKIALFQTSLLPGSTNSGCMPTLKFMAPSITEAVASAIADSLGTSMLFASTHGTDKVGAVVTVGDGDAGQEASGKPKQQRVSGDYTFTIVPTGPLQNDEWYDAVLESSIKNIVLILDDAYDLGPGIVTRFYTASAPQLRRVDEVRKDGNPSKSLIVQMSEEITASDVLSGGLDVVAGGSSRKGCVIWNDSCLANAADNPILTGFEYRLDGDLPTRFAVHLALSMRGSGGRTVGDAAGKANAVGGGAAKSESSLAYAFDKSAWRQRRNQRAFGWSNAE